MSYIAVSKAAVQKVFIAFLLSGSSILTPMAQAGAVEPAQTQRRSTAPEAPAATVEPVETPDSATVPEERRTSPPYTSQRETAGNVTSQKTDGNVLARSKESASRPQGQEEAFTLSLAELVGDAKPVTLQGGSNELSFNLPAPTLWQPTQITLYLAGTFSHALLKTSQLAIRINDGVVQQFPLDTDDKRFSYAMTVPTSVLRNGANKVQIAVNQHSTLACERVTSPELWTQIDLEQSRFTIQALPGSVPPRVDMMDALFDKSSWAPRPVVPVLTATVPKPDEIAAMGLIAQGVGNRYGKLPASLKHGRFPSSPAGLAAMMPAGSRGAIVLGTFANLGSYLEGLEVPANSGPIIAVRSLPNDPARFVVIVAAEQEAELAKAATAFAMPGVPWPNHPWVAINSLVLPGEGDSGKPSTFSAAMTGIAPLKALDFKTTTYTGDKAEGATLRLWNNSWRGRLQVRVHLAYASGMAPQSALNVLTNGTLHGSIPLNNPDGGRYYNYAVSIPAGSLKPGWNTLEFKPVLIPVNNEGACRPPDRNLAVTLYEDTVVQEAGGNELQQTDLALLAGLGASYSDGDMGKGIAVHLTDTEEQTVSAGLTMLAKLSQAFPGPLVRSWFGVGERPEAKHHLWVGPYAKLPDPIKKLLPAKPSNIVTVEVPLADQGPVPAPSDDGWLATLRDSLEFGADRTPDYASATVNMSGAFAKNSFAFTTRDNDRTVTVFTASSPWLLSDGVNAIVEPDQWNQLRGNLAFWSPGADEVSVISNADAPFSAYGFRAGLGIWLSHNPWVALAGLLVVVALLVLLTHRTLRFYRRRNSKSTHE